MDDIQLVMKVDTAPVDRAVRVMDNLEAELRDVERAMDRGLITERQFNAETARLNKSMDRLKVVARGSAKDFRTFEKSVYGSGKALRAKEIQMQQAGYQLQDFIVQVQAGTNPLIAFSQQGSQLAGFFAGPWGAALGLGIAALGGLGTALLGTKDKAEEVFSSLSDLSDLKDDFEDLGIVLGDSLGTALDSITEKIGKASADLYKLRVDMANFSIEQATKGLATAGDFGLIDIPFSDRTAGFGTDVYMRQFYKDQVEGLLGGIGGETLEEIDSSFSKAIGDIGKMVEEGKVAEEVLQRLLKVADEQGYFARVLRTEEQKKKKIIDDQKSSIEALAALTQAEVDKANESLGLQTQLKKESIDRLAATTTALLDEANLGIKIAQDADSRQKQSFIDKLSLATETALDQANYEIQMDQKANDAKRQNAIDTANFNFSLVEDLLGTLKDEQDELNDSAEELGNRLGIGFEAALKIIRTAKEEATVDLDAFGGAGDFKYSVPTYFDPNKGKKKGQTPAQQLDEYMKGLERTVKLEQKQVGVSEEVARTLELREEYEKRGLKVNESRIEALVAEEEALRKATEAEQKRQTMIDSFEGHIENAFMALVDGSKSVEDTFKAMVRNIILDMYQQMVAKQAASFLMGFLPFANGGAFAGGRVTPFASGGVVSRPTLFPMANGAGLMGEAGPEAIMPLKRGPDGKLGVEGGGGVTVVQNINVSTGVQQTVRTEIKSLMPQIAESAKSAVVDAKRRGGSYGRVFN